jgi:hypothetical protein
MKELRLSVIVISYNMKREIPRTLLSLSSDCQMGIREDDYEILVVDNGSTKPFDRAECQKIAANLRFFDSPIISDSPVGAVNHGLREASGKLVGVLIDGARLASPGLLSTALTASRVNPRAILGTLGFHIGPDVQMKSVLNGYDAEEEDALLSSVRWQEDPYRLFKISVLAASSGDGWFAPISESNALFMTKEMWDELGGYDDRFRLPGGGLANLDIWCRACEMEDAELIVLLGEGTFHQIHGGVATNATESPWEMFHGEYLKITGKKFSRPQIRPLLVGRVPDQALPSIEWSAANRMKKG